MWVRRLATDLVTVVGTVDITHFNRSDCGPHSLVSDPPLR